MTRRGIHRRGAECAEIKIGMQKHALLINFFAFLCVLCASAVTFHFSGCAERESNELSETIADAPRSVVKADDVELSVSAPAREIEVGEPLRVELTVLADANVVVELPTFDEALGPFEVRRATRIPPIPLDGGARRQWRVQIELMTFEEGELEVPAVEVTYRATSAANSDDEDTHEEAAPRTLESRPLNIIARSVVGVNADPSEFRDIKGAAEMPTEPAWKLWALLGGGAALLMTLAVTAILLARMRREPRIEPPLAPHEWALRELGAIERDQLIEQRAFEPFYVRLSAVVRGYLERRFGLMAPERTTDEFLHEARRSRLLRDEQRELLGEFLRAADMVKFAKHEPMEMDCREALASARSFVEQTVPSETSTRQYVNASTWETTNAQRK
jgi:hypothetical protein